MADDDDNTDKKVKIYQTTEKAVTYDIYPGETIESSEDFYDLLDLLNRARSWDHFRFHLNNFGGDLHATMQLIYALRETDANVTMIIEGHVYSAASILALCGNQVLQVNPQSVMMFHDYSTFEGGKGNEVARSSNSFQEFFEDFMVDTCYPFLTKGELKSILRGEDLNIHYKTRVDPLTTKKVIGIKERLEKLNHKRKSK